MFSRALKFHFKPVGYLSGPNGHGFLCNIVNLHVATKYPSSGETVMSDGLPRPQRIRVYFWVCMDNKVTWRPAGSLSIQYTFWLTQSNAIGLS